MKLFKEFLSSEEQEREIEEIPAEELQGLAIKFVLGVRKKNGEEYEPSSIRRFLQSVDWYLLAAFTREISFLPLEHSYLLATV